MNGNEEQNKLDGLGSKETNEQSSESESSYSLLDSAGNSNRSTPTSGLELNLATKSQGVDLTDDDQEQTGVEMQTDDETLPTEAKTAHTALSSGKTDVETQTDSPVDDEGELQQSDAATFPKSVATTSTNGDKSENNVTSFWSEHKGKIILGAVVELCIASAVVAYVLAYPAVALTFTVLAVAILVTFGIAEVCEKVENPNIVKVFTDKEQAVSH